jgi:hypothetical protein
MKLNENSMIQQKALRWELLDSIFKFFFQVFPERKFGIGRERFPGCYPQFMDATIPINASRFDYSIVELIK